MANDDHAAPIAVVVAWSPAAGRVECVDLTLPAGATLLQAIAASGWQQQHPGIDPATQALGVWGVICPLDHPLRDGDRVEVYRPLQVDPKEARRRRQRGATCSPTR